MLQHNLHALRRPQGPHLDWTQQGRDPVRMPCRRPAQEHGAARKAAEPACSPRLLSGACWLLSAWPRHACCRSAVPSCAASIVTVPSSCRRVSFCPRSVWSALTQESLCPAIKGLGSSVTCITADEHGFCWAGSGAPSLSAGRVDGRLPACLFAGSLPNAAALLFWLCNCSCAQQRGLPAESISR